MNSILDTLAAQLGGGATQRLAAALGGADEKKVGDAVSGALPLLMGALAKNSANPNGASALLGALDENHDGSILDDVSGYLGRGDVRPGTAILKHVLGGKQTNAAGALGKMSGLDAGQAASVLALLAPVVLGALGKARRTDGLDAPALAGLLRNEQSRASSAEPGAMRVFSRLLDQDGDGDVSDDLARMGQGLLGNLFRK